MTADIIFFNDEVVDHILNMAQFLLDQKAIDQALNDYGSTIDSDFYEAVR